VTHGLRLQFAPIKFVFPEGTVECVLDRVLAFPSTEITGIGAVVTHKLSGDAHRCAVRFEGLAHVSVCIFTIPAVGSLGVLLGGLFVPATFVLSLAALGGRVSLAAATGCRA